MRYNKGWTQLHAYMRHVVVLRWRCVRGGSNTRVILYKGLKPVGMGNE